jgi:hypothetical protein
MRRVSWSTTASVVACRGAPASSSFPSEGVFSEQVRFASKATGGFARNQTRKGSRTRPRGLLVPNNSPVKVDERIVLQPPNWGPGPTQPWRPWLVNPGKNVRVDDQRTMWAKKTGVMQMTRSVVNPEYRTVDIEPDIQRVYRGRELREEFDKRGELSEMSQFNRDYAMEELEDFKDPHWREKVIHVKPPTEKYQDPNLAVRGVRPIDSPLKEWGTYK